MRITWQVREFERVKALVLGVLGNAEIDRGGGCGEHLLPLVQGKSIETKGSRSG
jgi:hypothetical protein